MPYRQFFILLSILMISLPACPCSAAGPNQDQARQLINALGCKGCHQLQGDGGSLAPELDLIGSRMTQKQIRQYLLGHEHQAAPVKMPSYATTSHAELELISDYLYNLNNDD